MEKSTASAVSADGFELDEFDRLVQKEDDHSASMCEARFSFLVEYES